MKKGLDEDVVATHVADDTLILEALDACAHGRVEEVESFLKILPGSGFDELEESIAWACEACVMTACYYGQQQVLELILFDGRINVDFFGFRFDEDLVRGTSLQEMIGCMGCPILLSYEKEYFDLSRQLLEVIQPMRPMYGENTSNPGGFGSWQEINLLSYSACMNHGKLVKWLLDDDRVDPAFDDNQALSIAADKGNAEIVELLLSDHRVSPIPTKEISFNEESCPFQVAAATFACGSGNVATVKAFIDDERSKAIFAEGEPLFQAIRMGHQEVLETLMEDVSVEFPTSTLDKAFQIALDHETNADLAVTIAKYRPLTVTLELLRQIAQKPNMANIMNHIERNPSFQELNQADVDSIIAAS